MVFSILLASEMKVFVHKAACTLYTASVDGAAAAATPAFRLHPDQSAGCIIRRAHQVQSTAVTRGPPTEPDSIRGSYRVVVSSI